MSFSAEMKDFIGAWEKGNKILGAKTDEDYKKAQTNAINKKTETDYDPDRLKTQDEQAQANLAKTRAGTGLVNEQIKSAPVSRGYTAALTDRMKNADTSIGGYQQQPGSGLLPTAPAVGPDGPMPPTVPLQPSYGYAEGGAIPEAESPEEDTSEGGVEEPVGGAIPDSPATDISARRRSPAGDPEQPKVGYNGVISPQLVDHAVRGGYKYFAQQTGAGGRGTGARAKESAMRLATGQDALTPQEMDAARKAVDPENRLSESQRNMVALGSVYQYWANKGDPARADKVAFQMIQHYRLASQRYAAIAAAAAEHGNMDMATKAALKAYANVPDGRDMQISTTADGGLQYHYTDENGKTISKGIASPQEFASQMMGLTRGGFDQALLSSAAAREGGRKGAVGGATPAGNKAPAVGGEKVGDMEKRDSDLIGPQIDKLQAAWQKKNEGKQPDDRVWQDLRNDATHIMQANPRMTADEALGAAQALRDPSNDKFKTSEPDANGMSTIKFADGTRMQIDEQGLDRMVNNRAQALKAQDAEKAKAAEDAKPGRFRQGLERAGAAIGRDFEKFKGEVSGMIPQEMKDRAGSAWEKAKQLDADGGRILNDPNINYGTLTTAIKQGVSTAIDALKRGTSNPGAGAIPDQPDSPL